FLRRAHRRDRASIGRAKRAPRWWACARSKRRAHRSRVPCRQTRPATRRRESRNPDRARPPRARARRAPRLRPRSSRRGGERGGAERGGPGRHGLERGARAPRPPDEHEVEGEFALEAMEGLTAVERRAADAKEELLVEEGGRPAVDRDLHLGRELVRDPTAVV